MRDAAANATDRVIWIEKKLAFLNRAQCDSGLVPRDASHSFVFVFCPLFVVVCVCSARRGVLFPGLWLQSCGIGSLPHCSLCLTAPPLTDTADMSTASRKKKSQSNGAAAAASNGAQRSSSATAPCAAETGNNWGWGRPSPPPSERDIFAFEACPWKFIMGAAVAVPAAITYAAVGVSWWALLLLPAIGVLTALPILAFTLLPLSWQLDPAGPGCPEKFFNFNDKGQTHARLRL